MKGVLAIYGFIPPAHSYWERGATSWALWIHLAESAAEPLLAFLAPSFSREILFATERLSCLECFVLLVSEYLHSEFHFFIIQNKFKFTAISAKVFLLCEPPSSLPKALLHQEQCNNNNLAKKQQQMDAKKYFVK